MKYTTPPKGLPKKCLNRKSPYMAGTRMWCSVCKHTGGNLCSPVCKLIGSKDE